MAEYGNALYIEGMAEVGLSPKRRPQSTGRDWPRDFTIVSADSHWLEGDIWVEHYPEHLKERAPRMTFGNGAWHLVIDGKPMYPNPAAICDQYECVPGITSAEDRLRDITAEGVHKELIFPQRTLGVYANGDVALREYFFRGFNCGISKFCSAHPDRFYFAGIPNYWNPTATSESIVEVKDLGASALLVPINPRLSHDGKPILWSSEQMDPFWAAVQDSGLPICFHIGENFRDDVPGALGLAFVTLTQGFRPIWGALTFGGVFDRFPGLQVVFVEAGFNWVAGMLHEADKAYNSFENYIQPRLMHQPSWYWFNNCYATFMTDPAGLCLLDKVGPERIMWSTDYPHPESTFGYTRNAIGAVLDATDLVTARKILGETAIRLFKMH